MTDINKIIKIDILSIRPYLTLKNLIIILLMGILYPLFVGNIYTIFGVTQVFAIIFCSYPFLVGEDSGIDALYAAFGIQRKNVVYGRYLWSNLVVLICLLIALVFSAIVAPFLKETITFKELLYAIPLVIIMSNLIIASQYPFYFKYGYAKSKLIMSILFFSIAIFAAFASFLLSFSKGFFIRHLGFFYSNVYLLIFASLLLCGLLYFISIKASIKAYQARDLL